MRVTLLLLIFTCFLGLFLWLTLSGALFLLGFLFWVLFVVISIGYSDTAILFFLGAREVKSADEADFYAGALQEAYKLAVSQPRLYFYNGALERAFVLQNKKTISLVLSKDLIELCSKEELAVICFELLLQVKKNLAPKRTKAMFVIGMGSWVSHSMVDLLKKIIPIDEFRQSMNWFLLYMFHPWLELIFKFTLGDKFFRNLEKILQDYPLERDLLTKVASKLRKPKEIYSLTSRKFIEFSSVDKSRHYQNIMTLEFLPHEWDLIFDDKIGERA